MLTHQTTSDAVLRQLNADYIRAFLESDAEWYENHLAEDFSCVLPDGRLIDRHAFIERSRHPVRAEGFELEEVTIQTRGDFAIVQACTRYQREDRSAAHNRYTDLWVRHNHGWQALTAQITPVTAADAQAHQEQARWHLYPPYRGQGR